MEKEDGEIIFEGRPVNYKEEHKKLNGIQMVFQDPVTSINQRFSIEEAVSEPLILANLDQNVKGEVLNVLKEVGLPYNEKFFSKKIKSLSGGQKQKISIARALIIKPRQISVLSSAWWQLPARHGVLAMSCSRAPIEDRKSVV